MDERYPGICTYAQPYQSMEFSCGKSFMNFQGNLSQEVVQYVDEYTQDNVAKVTVYIENPYVKKVARQEKIAFSSFVANIGGLLGLFLGFSFISFIEILYLLFLWARSFC